MIVFIILQTISSSFFFFFFQAEDGIRDVAVTGVQTCALPISERVIVTCEELVDQEVTLSDPNRILFPETKVVAVVHEPGGAHPSPVQGHFKRDRKSVV